MNHIRSPFQTYALAISSAIAALIRLVTAPLSSGADVPQFWAFARVFQEYGLHFYRYADATLDIFPVKGWRFVYPPVWLFISRLSLFAAPASMVTSDMVDTSWRIAIKAPTIAADIAIGLLLFWAVTGSMWRKLLFAALWLFHPQAWYESAVFGQFDAVAGVCLLAAVLMLERKRDRLAFLFAGLALMTKQHLALSVVLLVVVSARSLPLRSFLVDLAIMAGVVLALSLPFTVLGDARVYIASIAKPTLGSGYQNPLMYAFSGSASLLTYLHNVFGWDTVGLFAWNSRLIIAVAVVAIFVCYLKPVTPLQATLVGFLLFIGLSYQVNYQYLIVYIPLAILAASRARGWEKALDLALAFAPAVWLWLFDVSFWFTYYSPPHFEVVSPLSRIGLVRYVPDFSYVALAVVVMLLCLTYVALTLFRATQETENQGLTAVGTSKEAGNREHLKQKLTV